MAADGRPVFQRLADWLALTSPHSEFVRYINNRNLEGRLDDGTAGDLVPEGLEFVSAADSPTGENMLIVANEFSGTVTMYGIK